jgi:hypothetical protein
MEVFKIALLELTYDTVKFIVQQFKTNMDNVQFTKLNIGNHMAINDSFWSYWVFDTYNEMVTWVTENLPGLIENIPDEEVM